MQLPKNNYVLRAPDNTIQRKTIEMKTKKLTPRNVAPVIRNTTSKTSAQGDGNQISPHLLDKGYDMMGNPHPFAGDDAE